MSFLRPRADYQTGNYGDKTESSVLAKTAPGFLDNLNQKLAEQRASNKAFQVRSYINSKVVVSVAKSPPSPQLIKLEQTLLAPFFMKPLSEIITEAKFLVISNMCQVEMFTVLR